MKQLPSKRYFGMTWIGWINVVLQLFFVRLAFQGNFEERNINSVGILIGAMPFTGWSWSPFKKYWPFAKYIPIKYYE